MSKRFFETAIHSNIYAQSRPTYPTDIIDKIIDYLSLKVESSQKKNSILILIYT